MSGFEVLAAARPLARLVKREGTLDGSVPLRVAQACVSNRRADARVRVTIAAGAPLLDVVPLSRAVAEEGFTQEEVR